MSVIRPIMVTFAQLDIVALYPTGTRERLQSDIHRL